MTVMLSMVDCDSFRGTHLQGFWGLCFRKAHFIGHRPDPDEICIETEAGDLTIHDGRLWHRVARSHHTGEASDEEVCLCPISVVRLRKRTNQVAHHLTMHWVR